MEQETLESLIASFETQLNALYTDIIHCSPFELEKLTFLAHNYRTNQDYYHMLTGHYYHHNVKPKDNHL